MKLQLLKRTAEKKSESKQIRREGNIPAIIYVQGKPAEPITVKNSEMAAVLRNVQPGRLSTTILELVPESGKSRRVVIKDIQYHVTTYNVQHLDFQELHEKEKITLNIPIECTGIVDCVGIKLGGALRQVIRALRVSCLPKDIPNSFEVDIKEMGLGDVKRLSDLKIPNTIRPIANLKEVAITIVKR